MADTNPSCMVFLLTLPPAFSSISPDGSWTRSAAQSILRKRRRGPRRPAYGDGGRTRGEQKPSRTAGGGNPMRTLRRMAWAAAIAAAAASPAAAQQPGGTGGGGGGTPAGAGHRQTTSQFRPRTTDEPAASGTGGTGHRVRVRPRAGRATRSAAHTDADQTASSSPRRASAARPRSTLELLRPARRQPVLPGHPGQRRSHAPPGGFGTPLLPAPRPGPAARAVGSPARYRRIGRQPGRGGGRGGTNLQQPERRDRPDCRGRSPTRPRCGSPTPAGRPDARSRPTSAGSSTARRCSPTPPACRS